MPPKGTPRVSSLYADSASLPQLNDAP